jgi:acetylcholinesterase
LRWNACWNAHWNARLLNSLSPVHFSTEICGNPSITRFCSFEQGNLIRRPIIFGDDEKDGSYFAANASTPADVAAFMVDQFPHLTPAQTDAINAEYLLMPALPQHAPYFASASAAYGESPFTCPSITVLRSYVQYFDPYKVWSYRVNIQQTDLMESGIGVPHTSEVCRLSVSICMVDLGLI